jgi:hypothetical protein
MPGPAERMAAFDLYGREVIPRLQRAAVTER